MNRLLIACILLFSVQLVNSQDLPYFTDYVWDENPSYSVENSTEQIISLKHNIVTEFYFNKENKLEEYFLEHKVLWLNSDEAIEQNNKVYIPYSSSSEIVISRARVIQSDGGIIELDESKMLDSQNEDTGQRYKYFAFEGIQKGSFIEFYYVLKKSPSYGGKRITVQSEYPKQNVNFELFSPSNLVFQFKSYNGLPEVKEDTLTKNKLHWKLKIESLKELEEEPTSAYYSQTGYILYKLTENTVTERVGISSYNGVTKRLYEYYYPSEYSKKTKSLLKKFISKLKLGKNSNEQSSIRIIENFIKTNVYLSQTSDPKLKNLDEVLVNKIASETGMLKLYIALLRELEIKHEFVITSNRFDIKFDKDFEAGNFLTDFLFFFPKNKTFLSPIEIDSRYPFPPANLTENYGLFIKEVVLGDFKSGIGKVKYIESIKADQTLDIMELQVDFDNEDLTATTINLDRSMSGYYAMYIQPFMNLIKEEDKDELIEGFAKNINENVEVIKKEIINDDPTLFGVKPLQVIVDFKSEAFVEKAGDKYLFNIGELIGTQMQLYQEKERVLPVESEFNRSYFRTIKVKIPEGYKFSNLDNLNIQNGFSKDAQEYFSFDSHYEIKDGFLIVTADEFYRQNIIPAELYEEYRKVINSAADFNKVTLVLERLN